MNAKSQSPISYRWDDLQVLLALARDGTLSAAGIRLGINPSTVGRRLEALESALGVRLFDRSPDGVTPTAVAERLLTHAELVEQAAHGMVRELGTLETAPEGTVRVTAPPGVIDYFVAPALKLLLERYPRLRVELDASVGYADLTRQEADIAIRVSRPSRGDLVAKRLTTYTYLPMAGRDWVASLPPLTCLDAVPWLGWGSDLAHLPEARWVDTQVSEHRVVLRSSSFGAQLWAASSGVGVALLPDSLQTRFDLAPLPLQPALAKTLDPFPEGELWLVGHRALRQVPRIQAVWDDLSDMQHGAFARGE